MRRAPEDDCPISTRLLLHMSRRSLTAEDIARATDMPVAQVVRVLTGKNEPLWFNLERIRRAVGITATELYESEVS
jgi:transcriptional regulator with XRE-family HTH domain